MMKSLSGKMLLAAGLIFAAMSSLTLNAAGSSGSMKKVHHVLLISVDGLHAVDLDVYIKAHPDSTLAMLAQAGTIYSNAQCSLPSDSFPGMVALVTGGSPNSTGIWYDHTYNRYLLPPGSTKAKHGEPGTDLAYDESIDLGYNEGKWGQKGIDPLANCGAEAIDPALLPVDPKTFKPVYPHNYILVNTVFEVARAAGLRTAWCDKHAAYDILNGPSGKGIQDLYTPEIDSPVPGKGGDDYTKDVADTVTFDMMKVQAIVNELNGLDHTGKKKVGVPSILGMNFQAVSVGQKVVKGGYADAAGTPTGELVTGLDSVDKGLGMIVAALKDRKLSDDTTLIITSKHGQSPIDPEQIKWVDDANLVPFLASHGITAYTASNDTCAFLWLKDPSQASAAADALKSATPVYPVWDKAAKKNLFEKDQTAATWGTIESIEFGASAYKDPSGTGRFPDLIVKVSHGSVFGKPWKKIAEHGGFTDDDSHVALLVSGAGVKTGVDPSSVETAQVAPTILKLLGLNPSKLQAVVAEKTEILPGIF